MKNKVTASDTPEEQKVKESFEDSMMIERIEPKQNHRFIVDIEDIPNWVIYGIERPKQLRVVPRVNEPLINTLHSDEEHSMVMYDIISPSTAGMVKELLCSKTRDIVIKELGSAGNVVFKWTYKSVSFITADFSQLNWGPMSEDDLENYKEIFFVNISKKKLAKGDIQRIRVTFTFEECLMESLV